MEFKTYKIGEIYQNNKYVPSLRFNGKWLEDLNFFTGEEAVVYQGKNMLVITKPNQGQRKQLEEREKQKELQRLQKQMKSL